MLDIYLQEHYSIKRTENEQKTVKILLELEYTILGVGCAWEQEGISQV